MPAPVFLRYIAAILISGGVLGFLGPGGDSISLSPLQRYGFWIGSCAIGWLQAMVIARGIRSLLANARLPGWGLWLITAVALSVPLVFEVRALRAALTGEPAAAPLAGAFMTVLVLNLAFSLIQFTLIEGWPLGRDGTRAKDAATGESEVDRPSTPPLPTVSMLRRKPDGVDGVISAINTEDHYLRIHCGERSDLVLYRMSDAVADLTSAQGGQVHRGWWVARHAIASETVTSRGGELRLHNGLTVPVSRGYVASYREWGIGDNEPAMTTLKERGH